MSDLQSARVVFDVSLEGRARKVVTLRSALMIKNKMDLPVEIKLQGLTSSHGLFSGYFFSFLNTCSQRNSDEQNWAYGSIEFSGKLNAYPFPKSQFCPK